MTLLSKSRSTSRRKSNGDGISAASTYLSFGNRPGLSVEPDSIDEAWRAVGDLYCQAVRPSAAVDCAMIEHELLFCLLGGFGITYEHGRSASCAIMKLKPFSDDWNDEDLFQALLSALMRPQFEPRRKDGSFRRYRFPKQKASVIVKARQWVRVHDPLDKRLFQLNDPKERRKFLNECPGVGFKTASWLLRNLGLGNDLAIIDVHLLRALMSAERIPYDIRIPRDYEMVEEAFLFWCAQLEAPAAAFDLFVWHWQRGMLLSIQTDVMPHNTHIPS